MDLDRVAALGESRLGIWAPGEARTAGVRSDQIARRVRAQEWQQVCGRALTDGGHVPDVKQRAAAAVAGVGPGAIAAGRTAARWWGWPLVDDSDPVLGRDEAQLEDVVCARRVGAFAGVTPHRWAIGKNEHSVMEGVDVTGPLRTLTDLARLLRVDALLCACDAAVRAKQVTRPELVGAAAALRGRPGGPALAWCAAWADGRAESALETLTRIVLWSPDLPAFEPQMKAYDDVGRILARLDHGVRVLRLGVESDGAGPHSLPKARYKDRHREGRVRKRGYELVRVTWPDVRAHRAEVRARVGVSVADQARRHGVDVPGPSALPAPPPEVWL